MHPSYFYMQIKFTHPNLVIRKRIQVGYWSTGLHRIFHLVAMPICVLVGYLDYPKDPRKKIRTFQIADTHYISSVNLS